MGQVVSSVAAVVNFIGNNKDSIEYVLKQLDAYVNSPKNLPETYIIFGPDYFNETSLEAEDALRTKLAQAEKATKVIAINNIVDRFGDSVST